VKSREEILEQLRKLNAMAESAAEIGNEHEAQAFAAKVQELLTAYKLSQADIRGEAKEPINMTRVNWKDLNMSDRRVRVNWTVRLGTLVAHAYYCEFIISSGYGSIGIFVGTETDRRVALYMYVTLARFLAALVEREYDVQWKRCAQLGDVTLCRGFKAGFTYGFLTRLQERFDEEVRPKVDTPLATTTAIVHVRKDALDRARAWMKDNVETSNVRVGSSDDGSKMGRERGKKAADGLDLGAKAIEKTGKRMEQIA
jgi:Protein of unknown function (DUF2786)